MDWSVLWQYRGALAHGFALTVAISVLGIIGSFIVGVALGCLRELRLPVLEGPITCYIEIVRNLPMIVKVFFFYYIVGMDAFTGGLVALVLHQSGYIADNVSAGFRSLPAEQAESGYAQALSRSQVFMLVLLPQVARLVLGPLTSQAIEVVKNSSIVMFVGVQELTFETQEIVQESLRAYEVATAATVLYVALTLTVTIGMAQVGRRLRWS